MRFLSAVTVIAVVGVAFGLRMSPLATLTGTLLPNSSPMAGTRSWMQTSHLLISLGLAGQSRGDPSKASTEMPPSSTTWRACAGIARRPLKDLGGEPAPLELLQFPQLPVEPLAFRRIMDILILEHLIAIGYPLE